MKPIQPWLRQLQKSLSEVSSNVNTTKLKSQVKSQLNSASEQMNKSLQYHYKQLPHYKSQAQTQLSKLSSQGKQLNTEFQKKFHDFSSTNPTLKRYHSKYLDQMSNLSKHAPKFNVKNSLQSTVDSTKQIASTVQSTAKQLC